MAERSAENWTYRIVFIALAAAIGFAQLLPLHPGPGRIPGPDVLMALAFAWVVMRPDYVPLALLVAVFFLADILFHQMFNHCQNLQKASLLTPGQQPIGNSCAKISHTATHAPDDASVQHFFPKVQFVWICFSHTTTHPASINYTIF